MRRRRAIAPVASALAFGLVLTACPSAKAPVVTSPEPAPAPTVKAVACGGGLDEGACRRASGLVAAASGVGNVRHEVLLDPTSSLVPGRGIEKMEGGAYRVLPIRCAEERPGTQVTRDGAVDASTIDYSYVGVSIDGALVAAETDLAPWLQVGGEAGEHRVSLVALAFVRDLDPQFFGAGGETALAGDTCACGRASHFVGAVKSGGLVSYEMTVRGAELHGRALDFVKARIARGDTRVTQTVVGGLEIEGLDGAPPAAPNGPPSATTKPLGFRVKNPVPIAFALYPLADVCRFAFPVPEVTPEVVDFGDVPYGAEVQRLVHVVNRAPVELRATLGDRTFAVPALGSTDLPLAWTPRGEGLGCEARQEEQTLAFVPRDASAPVSPKMQSVRIVTRARAGKATFRRHEHVDTGVHRKPDYVSTRREWTCPPDYALASCRTEKAECGDGRCLTDGYAVNAGPEGNGCRFACTGPEGLIPGFSSNFCRFDAVMECRLRCR